MNTSVLVKTLSYVIGNHESCVSLATWINDLLERSEATKKAIKVLRTQNLHLIKRVITNVNIDKKIFNNHIYETYDLDTKEFHFNDSYYKTHNEITKLLIENGAYIHKDHDYILRRMLQDQQDDMALFLLENNCFLPDKMIQYIVENEMWQHINVIIQHYNINNDIISMILINALTNYMYGVVTAIIYFAKLDLEIILEPHYRTIDLNYLILDLIELKEEIKDKYAKSFLENTCIHNNFIASKELIKYKLNISITNCEFDFIRFINKCKIGFNLKDIKDFDSLKVIIDRYCDQNDKIQRVVKLVKYGRLDVFDLFDLNDEYKFLIGKKSVRYGHVHILAKFIDYNRLEEYLSEAQNYNQILTINFLTKLKSSESITD